MIAIDAMGGDYAPLSIIGGAFKTAIKGIPVQLYGDEERIISFLNQLSSTWQSLPISIVHCSEIVTMQDEPSRAILRKKDSSLLQAIRAVADGKAQAVVSAGNSGASLVGAIMMLGKLPNILRPAIGGFLPTQKGSVLCTDLGANVDCKPEFLHQFAIMGNAYVKLVKGIESPRIALLSNGVEPSKGTKLIQQAYEILNNSGLHFIGNCEPQDILNGVADVVVCEGFSGNIMLKAMEATVQVVTQWLKDEGNKSLLGKCIGLLGSPVFKRLKKNIKKAQRGGALLLGVKKPLVIAHGSSNALAIEDAIMFAHNISSGDFCNKYNGIVAQLLQTDGLIGKNNITEKSYLNS